jgi:hypothetical protein
VRGPGAGRLLVLLVVLLGVALGLSSWPAAAATRTVTLTSSGPSPQSVTIATGDRISFVNSDSGSHTISSNAGAWSFRATIRPGASATTPAFSTAGHFGYSDVYFITVVQQNVDGSIDVKAAPPSPTPKPTTTRSPTPQPSSSPTRTASPRPSSAASTSASPAATASGLAIGPGIRLGVPPTGAPSGLPPQVAPSETYLATSPPGSVAYGPTSQIVQSSAHRFGLPVLLALLAAVGVLSLLVRLLLAEPPAAPEAPAVRRTPES